MALISVIVPCYNQAEFLDECLNSVFLQSFQDWECIVVNDGSSDHTEVVAQKWIEKDSRFRYFVFQNGGVAIARNRGIEAALGEWILPLDGDDKIGEKYLQWASESIKKGFDFIYCKANFFGSINEPFKLKKYSYNDLLKENIIFNAAIYRKKDWELCGGYDPIFVNGFEDWELWINLLKTKDPNKIIQVDYLGFFYRRKETSRDIEINKNIIEKKIIFRLIYEKHHAIYEKKFGSYHELLDKNERLNFEIQNLTFKNNYLLSKIRKNLITRFLFNIIEAI